MDFIFLKNYFFRASPKEAKKVLNGSHLRGQSMRLSWGANQRRSQDLNKGGAMVSVKI